MDEENNNSGLKEVHGSGVISTVIFMIVAIVVMIVLRHYLNY